MLDLTALDRVLKEIYVPAVREQMQKSTVLLSEIERTAENIDGSGRFAVIPLMLGYSEAVGARDENEDLPGARASRYERMQVPIRTNYGRIHVTGHAIRATQTDAGAFVRAVDTEMRNMLEGFKRDINRQMYGDGSGRLAGISAVGTDTVTVDTLQNIRVGAFVRVISSAGVPKGVARNVVNWVEATRVVTLDGAHGATFAAGDFLVREASLNKEIVGLGRIISTMAYPIVAPVTAPEWRANIVAAPTGYDILREMQRAYTASEKAAGKPDFVVTSFEQRDAYVQSLTTMRRIVNTLQLNFGRTGVEFNDIPAVADDQCPAGVMYFLNKAHLGIAEASNFDWGSVDGPILDKVPGRDAYTAFMYWAANLFTDRRNAQTVLTGLV